MATDSGARIHKGWYPVTEALIPTTEWRQQINERYKVLQDIILEAFDVTIKWIKDNVEGPKHLQGAPEHWTTSKRTQHIRERQRKANEQHAPDEDTRNGYEALFIDNNKSTDLHTHTHRKQQNTSH
eukprot:COSAG02_NODE_381_length_23450_cov_65.782493_21_plen_126_part_00